MIDHLDTQTNDFLENGTRGDTIHMRTFNTDFDYVIGGVRPQSKVINMDSWESTPVTSIFDCSDDVDELGLESTPASIAVEARRKESLSIDVIRQAAISVQGEEA